LENIMRVTYRFLLAVAVAWLSAPSLGVNYADAAPPISEIIVFGDSLSDTGNIFAASAGAVAPPPYYNGRLSNGPIWIDRLSQELGVPNPLPSFVFAPAEGGTNFAWSGAETGPGFSDSLTPNLGLQIDIFLGGGGTLSGDELIVIRGGPNDLFAAAAGPPGEFLTSALTAAANVADHVATLAYAGGEVFLVPNLGGIGQTPYFQLLGPPLPEAADGWEFIFNTALDALEADFATAGLDVQIVRFDTHE